MYARLPRKNFIDGLVYDKLHRLGMTPSEPRRIIKFLRRAYLDIIGRLPRRMRLGHFSMIRRRTSGPSSSTDCSIGPSTPTTGRTSGRTCCGRTHIGPASRRFTIWTLGCATAFRRNLPYDEFVRQLLTAKGSTFSNGAAVIFRDRREPEEIAPMVSQLFLGVRLDCAKCHHHPFEAWGQDDFYSFAAYFARIGRIAGRVCRLRYPVARRAIFAAASGEVKHPVSGKVLSPRPLVGTCTVDRCGRRSARTRSPPG